MRTILSFLAFVLAMPCFLSAQDKLNIKFGKITPADFIVTSPVVDSNANAVVIADIGSSDFEGTNNANFSLLFKRHRRVKIMSKNGFDAAKVEIYLYSAGTNAEEKVEDLKAVTYNLDNGKVVETKLENKNIFKENRRKNLVVQKFTLPDVKEGSIIEYTYTIRSDFYSNLQPWEFQGEYPCLWSEYEVNIPDFYTYVFLSQGYGKFFIDKKSQSRSTFHVGTGANSVVRTQTESIDANVDSRRWVMKDVPALKEESFTTTLNNHIQKIEFQLSAIQYPGDVYHDIMGNWGTVSQKRLDDEQFGVPISRANAWLDDDIKQIVKGATSKTESAVKIFRFVRDNFTSTGYGTWLSEPNSLKDIFKKKNGSVADINLLLIAMLRHEKIDADPVILSTRRNGVTHPVYPLMNRFNYLVCEVAVDSAVYYLDASVPRIGFGRLPAYCYNGNARVISKQPDAVVFDPETLKESKITTVFIANDEKEGVVGSYSSTLGYNESYSLRDKLAKMKVDDYLKESTKGMAGDIKFSNPSVDSLTLYDEPVSVKYEMKLNLGTEDIIYFNPLLNEAMKVNPFKSVQRLYPIEMPYVSDETYIFNMEVPTGYKVDELPKSARVKLNEDQGMFEYIILNSGKDIQFRCRLALNKATYQMDDYQTLRDFFTYVVKKEEEQIVFKKIK